MAQGVSRPNGLSPGPVRTLVHALHDLYQDAGMPSMRTISTEIRRRTDLPDTVSHETVGQMLRGESVPGWIKFESVVRHLAGVAVHRPDVQAEVARFHELWLAAVTHVPADTEAPAAATPPLADQANSPDRTAAQPAQFIGEVPPRNTRFVGREHLLRTIHEILRTGSTIVSLTGIGGVGKSQLAIEYWHRFRDYYDLAWWVPAEQPSRMRDSLANLGTMLNLPRSAAMQHPPAQVLDALRASGMRWLLVLDNAGAPDSLPVLTELGSGRVLVTSRHPDWAHQGSQLEIGVFERNESLRLLRDHAADITPEEADLLAARLGDLPLAIEQVAVWHQTTRVPVASYLDDLDQQLRKIMSDRRPANYPATVSGFLNVAFTQLAEAAPAAAQLLELFAWLGAEPLPLTLLRSGRQGEVTSPLREVLRRPMLLNSAVRDLRRHGLIVVLDGDPVRIQVHRVFQRALRDWLGDRRLTRGRANVQAILAAANPGEPDDARFWGHYAEAGPHVLAADLATAPDFEIRRVALDQMRYLFRIGHYSESIQLGETLIAVADATGKDELTETGYHFYILARQRLANAMRMVGRHGEAKSLTLEALACVERHPDYGPQDEYVAALDMNRAADLRIAGAYANAFTVDEAVLGSQLRRDVDDRDRVRFLRNNIAVNLRLLGRFGEAYEIDREIVRQWTDARGGHDPRTLFARSNLARDLFGLGRYADALAEVRSFLPTYRTVVGANHHGVLLAVRTEAMALRKNGEFASALGLAEQNRRDLATWFGQRHEYTVAAGISLVNARLAVGDLGVAAVEAPALLSECTELFGADHPMTLATLVNSASVLRGLGDLHGAVQRDQRATEALGRVLGAEHPYTLCANHNLAVDLALLGQDGRAMREAGSVLARSRAMRGAAHPDTLAGEINASRAGGAVREEILSATEQVLGQAHPLVVSARRGAWIECDIEPPPT
jgi:tetratricopeptide (TPR) repeat protein